VRKPRVGVVGAGTMGAGIAQLACLAGYETSLHDPIPEALEHGGENLRAALKKGAERDRWTEAEARQATALLTLAASLNDLADCQLVIEAAPEDLDLKRRLFAELEAVCGPDAVLATNTSSLPVSAIAAGTDRPQRICGMHFFNPPALMRLVEVVAGEATEERALEVVTAVAVAMGRTPVRAADVPGFVANRCARPFSLEGLRLFGEGISEPGQIDRIVRMGGGYRMGPFELTDLVGVDVNFEVAKSFFEQSSHEPRWQPHPIQARMVEAGRLGRKARRGYYDYADGPYRPDDPEPPEATMSLDSGEPAPVVQGDGFRAVPLEGGSLATLGEGPAEVGYVALPDLASARVVELARGSETSAAALAASGAHFASLGKHVECVLGDAPGLVLGRILCQLINEAHFAVGDDVATAPDIDTAVRLGLNHPRGPFEWCEAIGSRRVVSMLDALRVELGQERYDVAPLLRGAAADSGE
jgi:3-hydroxybutyryl-CoA dehydrogenase